MSFWGTVKRGFGYGLGGRLGWELGGWIWSLVVRAVTWLVLLAGAAMFTIGGPLSCSRETQKPAVQKPAAHQHQHQQKAVPAPRAPQVRDGA